MKYLGIVLMATPFVTLGVLTYMAGGVWALVIGFGIPVVVIGCLLGGAVLIAESRS